MGSAIDDKLTRHELGEALADMMTYYTQDWLVIMAGKEAYQWMQESGMITNGEYGGKYDHIPVRLDELAEPDMIYVKHKADI